LLEPMRLWVWMDARRIPVAAPLSQERLGSFTKPAAHFVTFNCSQVTALFKPRSGISTVTATLNGGWYH
jgi:hypothetical protein